LETVQLLNSGSSIEPLKAEPGRHKKILIVDNERHIRMLMTQALRKLQSSGVEIFSAESGFDALKLIDAEHPDLIFLDLMMPGLHGFDTCRLIKSDPATRNTYVIIVTARTQSVDRQMGSISGADEFIVKPFDPMYIAERAAQVLHIPQQAMGQPVLY
jgi:DNA-binding response OmpR family regulator